MEGSSARMGIPSSGRGATHPGQFTPRQENMSGSVLNRQGLSTQRQGMSSVVPGVIDARPVMRSEEPVMRNTGLLMRTAGPLLRTAGPVLGTAGPVLGSTGMLLGTARPVLGTSGQMRGIRPGMSSVAPRMVVARPVVRTERPVMQTTGPMLRTAGSGMRTGGVRMIGAKSGMRAGVGMANSGMRTSGLGMSGRESAMRASGRGISGRESEMRASGLGMSGRESRGHESGMSNTELYIEKPKTLQPKSRVMNLKDVKSVPKHFSKELDSLKQGSRLNSETEKELLQDISRKPDGAKRFHSSPSKSLQEIEKKRKIELEQKRKTGDQLLLDKLIKTEKMSKKDEDDLKKITVPSEKIERRKSQKRSKFIEYEPQKRNFRFQQTTAFEKNEDLVLANLNIIQSESLSEPIFETDREDLEFNVDESTNIRLLLDQMNDICEDLKKSIAENIVKIVQTENKLELGARSFLEESDNILDIFVKAAFEVHKCSECHEEGLINCSNCGKFFCMEHDITAHTEYPLHTRYAGSLKLESGVTIDKTNKHLVGFPISLPIRMSNICKCGQAMNKKVSNETMKCVDLSGCFEARVIEFHCTFCETVVKGTLMDFFASKLFPLNCNENSNLCVTFRLLELWEKIKNNSPPVSLTSFIKSITTNSLTQVKQGEVDQIYQQFLHLKFKQGKYLGENYSDCPVKDSKNCRLHSDGNSKLNRFLSKFQRKASKLSYFNDEIIMNDQQVLNEIEEYKKQKFVASKKGDALCGESHWKAAENRTMRGSVLDEKGINFVACSHYCVLQAVNQPAGELFCLHSMSISKVAERGYQVADVSIDIACKYDPWSKRLHENKQLKETLQFCPLQCDVWIGDVHSKGHSCWCRICKSHLWNGIGRASAGEQVEVLNSPLSQLRYRTRFMGSARRNDEITEFILARNKEKDTKIVSDILKTLERYEVENDSMRSELVILEAKHNFNIDESKIEMIKETARKVKSAKKNDIEEKIEVYAMSVIQKRNQLKTTLDSSLRNKVQSNLDGASKKLTDSIAAYNDIHEENIVWDNALQGIFPWNLTHLPSEMKNDTITFLKAAEIFLKLKRTKEEQLILKDDIIVILEKRIHDIQKLDQHYEDGTEWRKARFLKSSLLKEQLNAEIQLIRSYPQLIILPERFKVFIGKGRPLFYCDREKSPDEWMESVEVELELPETIEDP